jgi:uncharacterized protein (DUF305 family)
MNKTDIKNYLLFLIIGLLAGYIISPLLNNSDSKNHDKCHGDHCEIHKDMHDEHNHMSMHDMMDHMMYSLEGKTGDDFDRAFLEEMIVHHEGAVLMAREVLKISEKTELRNLANEIITAQEKEIEMMNNWLKEWFN